MYFFIINNSILRKTQLLDTPRGCVVLLIVKSIKQKLNNITGQIDGVKKMVDSKCDCEKVLIQLKAIRSAVGGIMDEVVESQFCNDKNLLIKLKKYVKSN